MIRMKRHIPTLLLAAAMLAGGATALADSASLYRTANVEGPAVTLADVADLSGDEAERFAEVEIATFPAQQTTLEVRLAEIRRELDRHGVHWGKLSLSGPRAIEVTRRIEQMPREDEPDAAADPPAGDAEPLANPVQGVSTRNVGVPLRDRIVQWLTASLDADAASLDIQFLGREAEELALRDGGYRLEFVPGSRDLLGRLPVTVRCYRGDQLDRTIRVNLHVRRQAEVVRAVRTLHRGRTITQSDVKLERTWLDESARTPATDIAAAVGQVAAGLIRADDVVYADDLDAPVLVKRRQLVTIRCLSGGVVLKTVGRALDEGADGDLIAVRNERTRETFYARVTGAQEAVLLVDDGGHGDRKALTDSRR